MTSLEHGRPLQASEVMVPLHVERELGPALPASVSRASERVWSEAEGPYIEAISLDSFLTSSSLNLLQSEKQLMFLLLKTSELLLQ